MAEQVEKPDVDESALDAYLAYLDVLRETCVTNMYGATPYLLTMFPELETKNAARHICEYWRRTFSDRHLDENKSEGG